MKQDEIEVIDVELVEDCRVRQRSDKWVDIPSTRNAIAPIQLRPGTDDGEVQIMIHLPNGTATMVECRVTDLRVALDLVEVAE